MKLTKQQRILGCVLAVGGCAIAFDKFVLGYSDPHAAVGATVASAAATATAPSTPQTGAQTPSVQAARTHAAPTKSLTSEIARLSASSPADSAGIPDPFIPPAAWSTVSHTPSISSADAAGQTVESPREEPVSIKLSMVMVPAQNSPEAPIAVLDGQPYALGSTIDGFTLASITSERVLLRKGSRIVELTIPRPSDRVERR